MLTNVDHAQKPLWKYLNIIKVGDHNMNTYYENTNYTQYMNLKFLVRTTKRNSKKQNKSFATNIIIV